MHRIKRVQIEFTTDEVPLAEALLARTGALHERRITPLLGRVCSELSGPDRRDRLDRLEVDLGCVDDDDDLIRKLEVALRSALSRALHDHRGAPRTDPALELLGLFARTGNLPWWSDHADGDPIAAAIARASDTSPHELLALLRELADDPTALARLARHDAHAHLTTLVADPASPASSLLANLREHLKRRPTRSEPGVEPPARIPHLAAEPANAAPGADLPSLVSLREHLAARPASPDARLREHPSGPLMRPDGGAEPPPGDQHLSAGPASDISAPAAPLAHDADLSSLLANLREHLTARPPISAPAAPLAPDADLSSLLARLREHLTARPARPEGSAEAPPRIQHLSAGPASAIAEPHSGVHILSAGPASAIPGPADPLAPDANLAHLAAVGVGGGVRVASLLSRLREHLIGRPASPDGGAEPPPGTPTLSARPANAIPGPADPRAPDADNAPPGPAEPLAPDADLEHLLARLREHLIGHPASLDGGAEPPPGAPTLSARPANAITRTAEPLAPDANNAILRLAEPLAPDADLASLLARLREHLIGRPVRSDGDAEAPPETPTLSAGPASAIPGPADPRAPDADLSSLLPRPASPDATSEVPTLSAEPASAISGPADPRAPDADLASLLASLREHLTGHPASLDGSAEAPPETPTLSARPASVIPGPADPRARDADLSSLLARLREHLAGRPASPDATSEVLTLSAEPASVIPAPAEPRARDANLTGRPASPDASAKAPSETPTLSAGPSSAILAPAAPRATDADLSSHLPEHLTDRPAPPDASAIAPPETPTLSAGPASDIPAPAGVLRPAAPPRPPDRLQPLRRRALERLAELRVDDAGLVLLCPFVERFFRSVGLVDERRGFVDEHAPMQAIALLSFLATGDPDPPEFVLPLAKLLCGRSPETDHELLRPLAPELLAEGERLLTAVIDHAAVLRDISIEALRGAFLRRPAILGVRDGAWLLQVERRPHDVLLERFPWSWAWIKLPWMSDPLRVEW